MLYPYLIPYYRKKGWEIVSDKMTYTIKDTQLPKHYKVGGMVERVDIDSEDVHRVHDAFTAMRHGALKRNELEWEEYWRWEADDVLVAVYYDANEKPTGYLVYYIANDVFKIKELVYINQEARHGLWNYISAHFSMIDKDGRQQLYERADGVPAGGQRDSGGNRAVHDGANRRFRRIHHAVSV